MVKAIREVETALGSAQKLITESERGNIQVARRSLVALKDIARGEPFTEQNLGAKRPGTGVSPVFYWNYLGRIAERDYRADEPIDK
jgi:N-acetylneuraminate synthase